MTENERIRRARKALNISQKDFAKAICISNTYLADIENGSRKSNDRIVKLVSMVYGVNKQWLKTGEGEMFYKSPDEKITRLVNIFNELPLDFQDYVLEQIEGLLKLRNKQSGVRPSSSSS
jgi:transcriptional regulator with XRE-family HTH domain